MHIYGIKVLFAQYYAKRSFYAGFLDIKVIGINLVFTLSMLNTPHIYSIKVLFSLYIYAKYNSLRITYNSHKITDECYLRCIYKYAKFTFYA